MIGIQRWVASQQSKAVLYDDEGEVKVQSEVDVGMHAILRTLSRAPAAEGASHVFVGQLRRTNTRVLCQAVQYPAVRGRTCFTVP